LYNKFSAHSQSLSHSQNTLVKETADNFFQWKSTCFKKLTL